MSPSRPETMAFCLTIPLDAEELVLADLFALGTLGTESRPACSPDQTVLMAYFEHRPGLEVELRQALGALTGVALGSVEVPEVDWLAHFRGTFQPLTTGCFLITPAWLDPKPMANQLLLRVDPGRAFGTGTHETTRLCLGQLEALAAAGPLGRVLDVGTGSGILAVAACLLGAAAVVAVDNDPEAVASARLHQGLNRVSFGVVRGDGGRPFRGGGFDLLLANLQAPILLARRNELASLCTSHGRLVLSGLLQEDLAAVAPAYAEVGRVSLARDGEWAAVRVDLRRAPLR